MIELKIEDIKQFTSGLFVGNLFDKFLLSEASFKTFNTFTIDGRLIREYYSDEELNELKDHSSWAMVKPFCYSLIKGRKLPESFRITLMLQDEDVSKFLECKVPDIKPDQVGALCINIRYEDGQIVCITGTSLRYFTLDKTLEHEWDEAVRQFFKELSIPFS